MECAVIDVKFVPEVHIERAAVELLNAYGRKFAPIVSPPVPAEEILECYLDLSLGFDDLTKRLGESGILGATWIEDRNVVIDQSLDPTANPRVEGRYRFTIAHEIANWILHRQQLLDARSAPLLNAAPEPSIICRASAKRRPIESQADRFAGYLLMPEEMVRQQWTRENGSAAPYVAADEIAAMVAWGETFGDKQPIVGISKRMAAAFHVSGQAMQIRLINLGLVMTEKPPRSLFE